jgi:signal transduction histidine kinase
LNYFKEIDALKTEHQNALLQSQLEIQEQTFQNIAREIHDNIGQKLTLAKLYLNTLSYSDMDTVKSSVNDSLELISRSIIGLSDVSRSMSTELLLQNGLVKGIEMEVEHLKRTEVYKVDFHITGKEVFLSGNAELVIFRIVQECINNFIKHAAGNSISIVLCFMDAALRLEVNDNGKGFDVTNARQGTGLVNINKRIAILKGNYNIDSSSKGTFININIPINESTQHTKPHIGG